MVWLQRLGPLLPWIALVLAVLAIGSFDASFVRPATLVGLFADSATLFLMAIGLTWVIYLGSIDLSVQSVAAVAAVVLAVTVPEWGVWAIAAALAAGAGFGLVSGVVHGVLRIPSFIATLAVGGIATTTALFVSDQRAIQIGAQDRAGALGWAIGNSFGIPNEVWICLAALAVALVVEQATPFGKAMKAVGCSEPAATVSGIRVTRIKVLVFALAGLFAALSGVVLAARLSSGSPTIAAEFLLPAIAAVVLGGTPLVGGAGGVLRTLAGTLLIAVVRTGMTYIGVYVLAQQIVFGLILIVAVGLNAGRAPKGIVK